MRLLHFAESGAVVGGVERYLRALLAAPAAQGGVELEHGVVTHAEEPCEYAGRWPSTAWPWLGPHTTAGPGPSLDGATPIFHAPPSPAALADLGGAPFAVFCHDHRWWCPSGSRFHHRTHEPCGIRAGTGACALRYHFKRCGSLRPAATVAGFARADIARDTLAAAGAVLVASHFMAREAVRHGARAGTVHVVPLPVPLVDDDPGAEPARTGGPWIVSVSRLTPEKGILELLEAFDLVRAPAALMIAGDGIAEDDVRDAAAGHRLRNRIVVAGRLGPADVRAAIGSAGVVAVPSLWPEPFGLAGIEALALGRPVVSSGAGGMADWSVEAYGVLTADPRDPAGFAHALDRALTEPGWAERARTTGTEWVARTHGMAAHAAALAAALADVAPREAA